MFASFHGPGGTILRQKDRLNIQLFHSPTNLFFVVILGNLRLRINFNLIGWFCLASEPRLPFPAGSPSPSVIATPQSMLEDYDFNMAYVVGGTRSTLGLAHSTLFCCVLSTSWSLQCRSFKQSMMEDRHQFRMIAPKRLPRADYCSPLKIAIEFWIPDTAIIQY